MTPLMFTDFMDAVVYLFTPILLWLLAFSVFFGFLASVLMIWYAGITAIMNRV